MLTVVMLDFWVLELYNLDVLVKHLVVLLLLLFQPFVHLRNVMVFE